MTIGDYRARLVEHGWTCQRCSQRLIGERPASWALRFADTVKHYYRLDSLTDTICEPCLRTMTTELSARIDRYGQAGTPYGTSFDDLDRWCAEQEDGRAFKEATASGATIAAMATVEPQAARNGEK